MEREKEIEIEKGVYVRLTETAKRILEEFKEFCRLAGGELNERRINEYECIFPEGIDIEISTYALRNRIRGTVHAIRTPAEIDFSKYDLESVHIYSECNSTLSGFDVSDRYYWVRTKVLDARKIVLTASGKSIRIDVRK